MLAPKPQPVLLQLASMDIRSYVSLRDGAKKQFPEELPPGREKLDYEFPREFFEFNSASGQLQIQPDYLQKWKEGYSAPSPAVKGCPARLSRSESKSNVVASLYRLQVENFFRFYIESGSVK